MSILVCSRLNLSSVPACTLSFLQDLVNATWLILPSANTFSTFVTNCTAALDSISVFSLRTGLIHDGY